MPFETASITRVGGRKVNEDYCGHVEVDSSSCFVAADGLGGHGGGDIASKIAVDAVLDSFREGPELSAAALDRLVMAAQNGLLKRQAEEPSLVNMRTTIVILVSDGTRALWAHLGDTRLYHIRGGRIVHQTKDHSVPQALVDAGEITVEQIRRHPDRNRLLRCLGREEELRPVIPESPCELQEGDAFLLCTDGFWDYVTESEMEEDLAKTGTPKEWLALMEGRVLERATGVNDNYTAVSTIYTTAARKQQVAVATESATQPMPASPAGDTSGVVPPPGKSTNKVVVVSFAAIAIVGILVGVGFLSMRPAREGLPPVASSPAPPVPAGSAGSPTAVPAEPAVEPVVMPEQTAVAAPVGGYTSPLELPNHIIFRPATKTSYLSIRVACDAAMDGEEIWVGPGTYSETGIAIQRDVALRGAGPDVTHVDFSGGTGLLITAGSASVEGLDLCCARDGAVVEMRDGVKGRFANNRVHHGRGAGILISVLADPKLEKNEVSHNAAGNVVRR
ncbi:MAG: protein phosphatase 2C domain-containing protein [Acidobacteriota bacterium]